MGNKLITPCREDVQFDCTISITLEKSLPLETTCYHDIEDTNGDDVETFHIPDDDVDWCREYNDRHYSILELLFELKGRLLGELLNSKKSGGWQETQKLMRMIEDCENWMVCEQCIEYENDR